MLPFDLLAWVSHVSAVRAQAKYVGFKGRLYESVRIGFLCWSMPCHALTEGDRSLPPPPLDAARISAELSLVLRLLDFNGSI